MIIGFDTSEMSKYRVYLFLTDRIVVGLVPKFILLDPPPEWNLKPKIINKPNLLLARRNAEADIPLPVNMNFNVLRR